MASSSMMPAESMDMPTHHSFQRQHSFCSRTEHNYTMKIAVGFLALLAPATAFVARSSGRQHSVLYAAKSAGDEDASASQMEKAKRAALDGVLTKIEKSYGRGSIVKLGDADNMIVESISTGALTLDTALGGGYPKGRVVEIYGPESSGKTTLALHAIAESQAAGGTAAFVDAEHALDPAYGEFIL